MSFYYNNTKVGQIMGRITNDLFDVTEFAHHCPEEIFVAFIKTVVGFIILSTVNLYLTVIIFCVVPIMLVVCLTLNRKMKKAFAMQMVQIGELNARIEDCLLGMGFHKTTTPHQKTKFNRAYRFFKISKKTGKFIWSGPIFLLILLLST